MTSLAKNWPMKNFQLEMQEVKNYTESMGGRSDQSEDKSQSCLEDDDSFKDQPLKDISKTTRGHCNGPNSW